MGMYMELQFRAAREDEAEAMAGLSARAFADYPLYGSFRERLGRGDDYLELMRDLQLLEIRLFMKHHCCFVATADDSIVGIALLERPDAKRIGLWEYLANGAVQLVRRTSFPFMLRFLGIVDETRKTVDARYKGSWHLNILAVDEGCQGKRVGSRLIGECIAPYIAKHGGGSLTLTTNTPENKRFYARNGFSIIDESVIERKETVLPNWSFEIGIPSMAPAAAERPPKRAGEWQRSRPTPLPDAV